MTKGSVEELHIFTAKQIGCFNHCVATLVAAKETTLRHVKAWLNNFA